MNYGPDVVEDVLDELGVEITATYGHWGSALCPIHEDNSSSFTIHLEEGGWKCYSGCGSSSDLAELVRQVQDADEPLKDIQRRLRRRMPNDNTALLKALEEVDAEAAQVERRKAPLFYETGVAPKYMLDRGFTVATLKAWQIGWDPETESVVIPATENGEIVGLIRRKLNWNGRGAKYKNSDGFLPSDRGHLFGLDKISDSVSYVVLVEGPLDAVWLWQCGVPAVAMLGASLSARQEDALRRRFWRVVIATDADKTGVKAAKDIAKQLAGVYTQRFPIERGKKDVQQSAKEYIEEALAGLPPVRV